MPTKKPLLKSGLYGGELSKRWQLEILLGAEVSVICHRFKPIYTYVFRSATDYFSVMNGHFYDIKNIPRPPQSPAIQTRTNGRPLQTMPK